MTVFLRKRWTSAMRAEFAATLKTLEPADHRLMRDLLGDKLRRPYASFQMPEANDRAGVYIWNLTPMDDVAQGAETVHLFLPPCQFDPFHSHVHDSNSRILAGGYDEIWRPQAWRADGQVTRQWRKGDYVERRADEGHYLTLPPEIPYALTRYNAGPAIRRSTWEYDPLVGMLRR